jgi:glycine dehydrogenase subunit 2
MTMNTQGRPTGPGTPGVTTSGAALLPDEPLVFEIGDTEHSGVDLPEVEIDGTHLGEFERRSPLNLAGLTEPEALRHYVRLSRLNYSIDSGMYPLGSCTMKHNPPVAAGFIRAGRARADDDARRLARHADQHHGGRHDAKGRRPR